MCVRPACYIPPAEIRAYTAQRQRRRLIGLALEVAALAAFVTAVLIWSSIVPGLMAV